MKEKIKSCAPILMVSTIILAAAAACGALLGVFTSDFLKPFLIVTGIGVLLVLLLWISFLQVIYEDKHKYRKLYDIYDEKGLCDEYLEEFRASHPKPKKLDRITEADLLITLDRFDEAETILDSLDIGAFADDDHKAMFNCTRLSLYCGTLRAENAAEILEKHGKHMEIYFNAPIRRRNAGAFYGNAALTAAMNGDEISAQKYLRGVKQWSDKYEANGIMGSIMHTAVSYALGRNDDADAEYDATRIKIEGYESFPQPWNREFFLNELKKVQRYKK